MIFIGNIGKDYDRFAEKLRSGGIEGESLFQLGDFGIGLSDKENVERKLNDVNEILKSESAVLYIIRGDWDNPFYFTEENFVYRSNVRLVPDYKTMKLGDYKILPIGGGMAFNRKQKHKKGEFWKEEKMSLEVKRIKKIRGVNLVISHKPPSFVFNTEFEDELVGDWFRGDSCMEYQLNKEREDLRMAFKYLKRRNSLKYWISSHLTYPERKVRDGVECVSLDAFEFFRA